jgi:ATP-dependent Lhr-like helicase
MTRDEYLQMTEEKGLIVGLKGERLISGFKFYAVFKDSEDYTVRHEAEEIGTISEAVPQGERFALAGRVWEVLEIDVERRLIYVKSVEGKMEISWPGDSGEIHTKILQRMRRILFEDVEYPYLMPNARQRLAKARHLARNAGMEQNRFVFLSETACVLFPWLGTRAFRTLRRFLATHAAALGISGLESEGCCYMTFKVKPSMRRSLERTLEEMLMGGFLAEDLVSPAELPAYDKFDDRIPPELLRMAYARDRLDPEGVMQDFLRKE